MKHSGGQTMMILFCVLSLAGAVAFFLLAQNTAAHDLQKRYDDWALGASSALEKVEAANESYDLMRKRLETAEATILEMKQKSAKESRTADVTMSVQMPDKPILVEVVERPAAKRLPIHAIKSPHQLLKKSGAQKKSLTQ